MSVIYFMFARNFREFKFKFAKMQNANFSQSMPCLRMDSQLLFTVQYAFHSVFDFFFSFFPDQLWSSNQALKTCKAKYICPSISVADPGCLSRIPDPDFYPSRIPDPITATKERGEKKLFVIPFYVATNFTKL
jgi:hypothetical protein